MEENFTIVNTQISGSELVSNLTGNDMRNVFYTGAIKQLPVITQTKELTVDDLLQASVGSLLVDSTSQSIILRVGEDTPVRASNIIEMFNITSVNDIRRLTFTLVGTGNDVELENNSATGNYVRVSNLPGDHLFLVANGLAGTYSGDVAGYQRIVLLQALDVTPGQEVVNFKVMVQSK